jgi:hypothetical protein
MSPPWSSDGRKLYLASNATNPLDVYVKEVDNSTSERPLGLGIGSEYRNVPQPRAGKHLAYISEDPATKRLRMQALI